MTKALINIECTIDQAYAISEALEIFSRLSMGQFDRLAEMVVDGSIPVGERFTGALSEKLDANDRQAEFFRALCAQMKSAMGYSHGYNAIGHPHVSLMAKRAWEVRKAIQKTLSEHRDPTPEFKGVDYDGLFLRHTDDPEPIARIVDRQ